MLNRTLMRPRLARSSIASVLTLFALTAGCAKQPATAQSTAPSPTGRPAPATSSAPTPPASSRPVAAPRDARGPSPTPAARPAPADFVHVRDVADVHFDFDAYAIRPSDMKVLDANAEWLRSRPDHIALIEGHCDERGTVEYNLALGERRAKAAMNYLVSRGIAARRLTIVSYGEEQPACSEKAEACWARNRRAHFKVKRQ